MARKAGRLLVLPLYLCTRCRNNPEKAKTVLAFFSWAFHHGGEMAKGLHYVPIPGNVVELIEDMWVKEIKDSKGNPVVFRP